MNPYTAKQRMLNAYRGIYSDHYPVAPEFWYFYPAKVLGLSMVEFQREVPHWQGMLATFRKFQADGWGIVGAEARNPHIAVKSNLKKISDDRYRDRQEIRCDSVNLERSLIYHLENPCWAESYPVRNLGELAPYVHAVLSEDVTFDFSAANRAFDQVGEDFLLEFDLGAPFFDFFEGMMGFEEAILFFLSDQDDLLQDYFEQFLQHHLRKLKGAIENTKFESFFIGCSSSCNALLGPVLWRKWDKPYLQAITAEAHKYGKLVHNHNHGKVMETVGDFVDIGFDCVCPFERYPGDIIGIEGLREARRLLAGKVTFNGNVSTVDALIRGTTEIVRQQVREIKEAFQGSPRLVIGTGDQVGAETPEENILAMIDEGRKK